jgi:putative NADH-flavin reductase
MPPTKPASRVLLLGATGNLGLRLIPALLAHNHVVTAYVRSPSKLQALLPESLFSRLTIVLGDATASSSIKQALLSHDCDSIVDVAGNQVWPWKEYLLPKIAQAVVDAAVAVGKERGRALRAWFIGGLGSLEYPGMGWNVQDL